MIPVTLADGRKAQLVIPVQRLPEPENLYMRDGTDLYAVQASERGTRIDRVQSPTVVETRRVRAPKQKRSWEREALIVGGSAGAGTLIGGIAGGRKGAAVGAAAGGIGGLIYDLTTRNPR